MSKTNRRRTKDDLLDAMEDGNYYVPVSMRAMDEPEQIRNSTPADVVRLNLARGIANDPKPVVHGIAAMPTNPAPKPVEAPAPKKKGFFARLFGG